MAKIYIGADNGVTGGWAILSEGRPASWFKVPTFKVQNYTKHKQQLSRVDVRKLTERLKDIPAKDCLVVMERPMVTPRRFKQSLSAVRALEATLIVLDALGLKYIFVDSKEWQHVMLPANVASDQLKEASKDEALKLFPHLNQMHDGDAPLMAEWARRKKL